jgi:hypothetical protein
VESEAKRRQERTELCSLDQCSLAAVVDDRGMLDCLLLFCPYAWLAPMLPLRLACPSAADRMKFVNQSAKGGDLRSAQVDVPLFYN